MNWDIVKLGDLTSLISSGSTPLGGSDNYLTEGPVMFIRSQNVHMNLLVLDDVAYISDEIHHAMKRTWVYPGDVLLNITGASIGRVSAFELENTVANVNQHVCIIRPKPEQLYARYLAHFLSTSPFQKHIDEMQHGGTRQALTFSQIANFEIPLPPLAEQQRIATILDQADALRTKRRAALAKLDTLLQATFLHMFGDPVTNPLGWEVVKLSEISDVDNGVTKSSSRIKGKDTVTLPYMRVANVQDGKILTGQDDVKTIEVLREDAEKYLLKPDDILLTEGGDPDKLGRGGIWKGEIDPCIHQNHIFRVRISDNDFLPEYISALIGSLYGKNYFLKAAKQTTGIATINKTQLCAFPIQRASIDLQYRFRQFVKKLEVQKSSLEVSNHELDNLFHSLQQRAFKGEL